MIAFSLWVLGRPLVSLVIDGLDLDVEEADTTVVSDVNLVAFDIDPGWTRVDE